NGGRAARRRRSGASASRGGARARLRFLCFPADFTFGLHGEYPGLIRGTDYGQRMSGHRQLLVRAKTLVAAGAVAALALFASSALQAARGAPPAVARDLAQLYFANTLTRAEVLSYVGRVPHDYRIDEGKVIAVRQGAVDLLERDGTRQSIPIGSNTLI